MTKEEKAEFGDFQTPQRLANDICRYLASRGVSPASIIEPTCGEGSILTSAANFFPQAQDVLGFEINAKYVSKCRQAVTDAGAAERCRATAADFFEVDWPAVLSELPDPVLIVGNPPWVTNAALGSLGSSNLPAKSNFKGHKGLDAITGKSNFDISEWMLLRLLEWLDGRNATLAMLCKTVVARKVLQHAWKRDLQIRRAEIHRIDAAGDFNAAVDACLLHCDLQPEVRTKDCHVFETLNASSARQTFGYHDGKLVSDLDAYSRWQHLLGKSPYRWRSGVKHDCSKVMELSETDHGLQNGFGEVVDVERTCLYPMLKSSELANGRTKQPRRWMVVTQQQMGQETVLLERHAPKTWRYLISHAADLDSRGSSIYRNRPRFSVFGIGGYSFAPWKVAISGFYKSLNFAPVGPYQEKPIVLDDTGYLLACESQDEAEFLYKLLASEPAQGFYSSLIFWDAKRPITTELLSALSLVRLAEELGRSSEFERYCGLNPWAAKQIAGDTQSTLFKN